ncbi:hypothetical protein KZC52_16545 [Microbacterium sp. kSW2-24]|uniref:sunset domain-containing protein n=1 Tax=Microbacterium galbinum TaxID=2851646 RepID=UPI001FFC9779|nr:hypothetical protein [Microbacterium galbinum]MCK2024540.1 hypothetical protein [Microbacterium galbinum]
MAIPLRPRFGRSVAVTVAAVMLASMLIAVATPAASAQIAGATVAATEPAFASFADRLPRAAIAAAERAAQPTEPVEGVPETGVVAGTVTFPAAVALASGSTYVVAYSPGSDVASPLAAAPVGDTGSYSLQVPVGEVLLAVVSRGRAVFDRWGVDSTTPDGAATVVVDSAGLAYDVALTASALVSGSVTVPAGVDLRGRRIAVAVYPGSGTGTVATSADYVSDTGTFAVGGLPAGDYRVAFVSAVTGASSEWWNDAPGIAQAERIVLGAATVRTGITAKLESLRLMEAATPTITGSPTVGQKLSASTGSWTSGAALTYQWLANGVAISKATAATFVVPASLVGKKISVQVVGRKATYLVTTRTSVATSAVVQPMTAPVPKVSGSAIVGQTLTAAAGTWTAGAKLTYQWYVSGVAVPKATTTAFKIPATAAGKTITVVVTGTKAGFATAAKRSVPTSAVLAVLAAPTPTLSGSAVVGNRLTAAAGAWTAGTRIAYAWYLDGKAIANATGSTLSVTAGMVGKRVTVRVTGAKSGYVTAQRTSTASAAVTYPNRTTPVSSWDCPSWAPIKGNASSHIYHVPSGAYYSKTKPEECFRTEAAAVKAGYRKSKR